MSERKELVSLTLGDEKFESFPDLTAREALTNMYKKDEIDTIMGSYITEIDTLLGGDS